VANFAWAECRETPGEQDMRHDSPIFINRPLLEGARYRARRARLASTSTRRSWPTPHPRLYEFPI
jgi:hypothetical protein